MNMAVEMVDWIKNPDKPFEGFDPPVRKIIHVVDAGGWGVGDKHIQVSPIPEAVYQQSGYKRKNP
jgi:hypothetical protein